MYDLSLLSYAKINLGLALLNKREDGFHNIATLFQQISLHDKLSFKEIFKNNRITSSGLTVPLNEDNLVLKALQIFQKAHHIQKGMAIHIEKKIPIGGGLGGGSSNAAMALIAANYIWKINLSQKNLEEMAIEIGSDVPFFIRGGTSIGKGRGEQLSPVKLPTDYWIVLICPDIEISTAWAYKHSRITLTKNKKITKFNSIFKNWAPHALSASLENDLEGVVFQRHPILKDIKEQLYQKGAFYASMSGSGSSIYGLFSEKKQAEAAKLFFYMKKKMQAYLCRPISTNPIDQIS